MPFNLAEARLSTIKELQKQLKKWKKYCGKAEDRLDKEMKLNEDLQRRATMYQFMSEYMEKAGCMGEYFDYIRENYPDKQEDAGVLSD